MLLKVFDENEIREAAKHAFPNTSIQVMKSDIYVKDTKAGRYQATWLDRECYVSTEYVYEDILVNGNKTRYKIEMSCILVKQNPYDIIYDTKDCYYVAYEEAQQIKFKKYMEVVPTLPSLMKLLEEIQPV